MGVYSGKNRALEQKAKYSVVWSRSPVDVHFRAMHPPIPLTSQVVMITVSTILTLAVVLGNGFVLAVVARFKALRTVPNLLIANLATVDLLNVAINMPICLIITVLEAYWFRGKALAIMTTLLHRLFTCLNLASRLLMMTDACLAITYDMKYLAWKTNTKACWIISLLWLTSIALVSLACESLLEIELGDALVREYRVRIFQEGKTFVATTYTIFICGGAVLGILIFRAIRIKRMKRAQLNLGPLQTQARLRADIKAIKTIAISLAVYISGHIPYILYGAFGYKRANLADSWFGFIGWNGLFVSSAANPLIYYFRASRFRSALRQFMKDPFGNSKFQEAAPARTKYNRTDPRNTMHKASTGGQAKVEDVRLEPNARHMIETQEIANEAPMPLLKDQICPQAPQFHSKINSINCPEQEDGSAIPTPSKSHGNKNEDPQDRKTFQNRHETTLKRNTRTAYLKKSATVVPSKISHLQSVPEITSERQETHGVETENSQSPQAHPGAFKKKSY